jgi:ATP-dependent DNA helicase RecG
LKRLEFFLPHHDGFKIAEMDLSLRGPGEVAGFRQTGWDDLKMADIIRDAELFREIEREIDAFLPKRVILQFLHPGCKVFNYFFHHSL